MKVPLDSPEAMLNGLCALTPSIWKLRVRKQRQYRLLHITLLPVPVVLHSVCHGLAPLRRLTKRCQARDAPLNADQLEVLGKTSFIACTNGETICYIRVVASSVSPLSAKHNVQTTLNPSIIVALEMSTDTPTDCSSTRRSGR